MVGGGETKNNININIKLSKCEVALHLIQYLFKTPHPTHNIIFSFI